jgi:Family of unknown function (DUF6331)
MSYFGFIDNVVKCFSGTDRESHKYDIPIGNNEWIEGYVYNGDPSSNIDEIIDIVADLWDFLETNCVAQCCSLEAFDFSSDNIKSAVSGMDQEDLADSLRFIINEIAALPTSNVITNRLNVILNKAVFLTLLNHLLKTIVEFNIADSKQQS